MNRNSQLNVWWQLPVSTRERTTRLKRTHQQVRRNRRGRWQWKFHELFMRFDPAYLWRRTAGNVETVKANDIGLFWVDDCRLSIIVLQLALCSFVWRGLWCNEKRAWKWAWARNSWVLVFVPLRKLQLFRYGWISHWYFQGVAHWHSPTHSFDVFFQPPLIAPHPPNKRTEC